MDKQKILLINPPIRETAPPAMFPSGLGYIAATLLEHNYDVNVLDINGYRYDKETVKNKLRELIWNKGFNILGIGCLITCYNYVKWLIAIIREIDPKTKVIIGGGIGSSIPELCIEKLKADIAVIGEGEIAIINLLEALEKNKDLSEVNSICFKEDGKIIKTPKECRIKDIGILPFPAWHLFAMEEYIKNQFEVEAIMEMKKNSINVIAGRGCPYHCTYCYETFEHYATRRPVENVIEELKILRKRYNIEIVYFTDDLFCGNKQWTLDFCDAMIRENLGIIWLCCARVNVVDEELIKKMKQAGCILLNYGIESGSQKMLDIMKKGVTTEQAAKAISLTRKMGLRLNTSFMMGFPEETKETLDETARFCIDNDRHLTTIFFVTPYPGTALYEQARKDGLIKDEEEYISRLGNATEFTINLTKWSDEELFKMRDYVISKVHRGYFKKHKLEYLNWLQKKMIWYRNYIRSRGLKAFVNAKLTSIKKILSK
ncbi:MAG: radical SAM protein [archaeon]